MSGNVINSHLVKIINNNITKNAFSEKAKVASARPIFKNNEREKIKNYRPANILICFPKVYEKFFLEKFKPFINSFLSEYIAAYRENYSTNHFLIRCQKRFIVFQNKNIIVKIQLLLSIRISNVGNKG